MVDEMVVDGRLKIMVDKKYDLTIYHLNNLPSHYKPEIAPQVPPARKVMIDPSDIPF